MIAIPNINKPNKCHKCIAFRYEQGDYEPTVYCYLTKEELYDPSEIPANCPLIEIDQEDEEAVLYLARMRKAMREGKSLREFLDGERRNDDSNT